jgi:hypothetical protein
MEHVKTRYADAADHSAAILSLLEPFSHFTKTCRDAEAGFSALIDVVQLRQSFTTCADKFPLQSASEWMSSVHTRLKHFH